MFKSWSLNAMKKNSINFYIDRENLSDSIGKALMHFPLKLNWMNFIYRWIEFAHSLLVSMAMIRGDMKIEVDVSMPIIAAKANSQ
jgi:hypothetical protein